MRRKTQAEEERTRKEVLRLEKEAMAAEERQRKEALRVKMEEIAENERIKKAKETREHIENIAKLNELL